jgi:hypothetical protein
MAAGAGVSQARHEPKQWGGGAVGFGKRTGAGFATHGVKTTVEHAVAAPLHEDLHYHRSNKRGFGPRLGYALKSTVVTRNTKTGTSLFFVRSILFCAGRHAEGQNYKQMFDTAAEKQVNKILVNTLAMDGHLSPLESYHLGVQVAAYLKQRKMNPRLAVVGKPPAIDGLGVGVARSRRVTAEAFPSEQEALDWLDK